MNSFNNVLLIILFLLNLVYAKTQGDPQNTDSRAEGGGYSFLVRSSEGNINAIVGQATYHTQLAEIFCKSGFNTAIDLYYNSVNTTKKIASLNENEPVGWVGLGWQLGYSSIKVIHNFTVDMTDDKWFFQFSNGAISEIIKNGDNFRVQPQI